jgi:transposase-like protein
MVVKPKVKCPECGYERCWKNGFQCVGLGKIQRYYCTNYCHRFTPKNQDLKFPSFLGLNFNH